MNRYARWCKIYTELIRHGRSSIAEDETYTTVKKHIAEAMHNEMMQPSPEGADISAAAEMVVEIWRVRTNDTRSNISVNDPRANMKMEEK